MECTAKIFTLSVLSLITLMSPPAWAEAIAPDQTIPENWHLDVQTQLSRYKVIPETKTLNLKKLALASPLTSSSEQANLAIDSPVYPSSNDKIPDPLDKKISHTAEALQPIQTQNNITINQPLLAETPPAGVNNTEESINNGETGANSANAETALAEAAQNPIANLISVPFQNNTNFGVGDLNRTQNILNIQPVIPFDLNEDWLVVTRTILPVIYQPALTQTQYSHFGLGDLNPSFFFVPKTQSKLTWGVGPTFLLPTATDDSLGTGKWALGPAAVMVFTNPPWVIGGIVNNLWSVAGDGDRSDVSQFLVQPLVNYNLPNGWYLVSSPIITANWNGSAGDQWTVPVGGGFGRVFNLGPQPVNLSLQGYWNATKPKGGADWSIRTQIQLLFPKG